MKPLTDEQLERAARKLCELRGIDPDAQPFLEMFKNAETRNWQRVVGEVMKYEQLDIALRFGRGE